MSLKFDSLYRLIFPFPGQCFGRSKLMKLEIGPELLLENTYNITPTPIYIYIYISRYPTFIICIDAFDLCTYNQHVFLYMYHIYSKWFLWKAPDFFRSRDALVALCCIEMLGLGNWQMGLGEDGIGGNAEEGCQEDIHSISTHLHLTCQAISFIFSILVSTSRIYEYIYICT